MVSTGISSAIGVVDVISSSLENLVTVVFPKSRASSYDAAVSIAQYATSYSAQEVGKSTFHFASFGKNQEQAARALSVIRFARSIKGFQVYARGRQVQDSFAIERVISCFLDSTSCNDSGANCIVMLKTSKIISTDNQEEGGRFVGFPFGVEATTNDDCVEFPCRFLAFSGFKINPLHPASIPDQIQAGGVRIGCSWCPNFPHD